MVWIITAWAPFPDAFWGNAALSVSCLCGGISSVTGAAAFNELKQRCLCFACSFRAGSLWAEESWWGQRDTGFTLLVPFKKRKTHGICSVCSLKNQHFPEFNARFENKSWGAFAKLQWDVLPWVWSCTRWEGMVFAPHHSVVVCWVAAPAAKATQCFCLRMKCPLSPNPLHNQMSLKMS